MSASKNQWSTVLCAAALCALGACGDDDGDKPTPSMDASVLPTNEAGPPSGDTKTPGDAAMPITSIDAGNGKKPIYLVTTGVWTTAGSTLYTYLRNEIDFDISLDDLKTAREFPGYTGIAPFGEYIVTGDSESPFATKYKIGDDLSWTQVGDKLNFGKYFTDDADGLNFYFQSIRGNDMNFFYGAERTSRAHWNIEQWKIVGDHTDTQLPSRPGWTLTNTGNRTGIRDWKGGVMQTFVANETATEKTDTSSYIAVYDEVTQAEKKVITVTDCPELAQATMDEDGNVYFATTYGMPIAKLYNKGPASCVIRVKPDGTVDDAFVKTDLSDYTGGFYGVNFRYIGKGKALANILHHDRLGAVNWQGEVDRAVQTKIEGYWDEKTETDTPEDASLWELHLIDLASKTSKIVTGFAPEHDVSFYTITIPVDGRTFFSVQYEEGDTVYNAIYELDVNSGSVTRVGRTIGDSYLDRVR